MSTRLSLGAVLIESERTRQIMYEEYDRHHDDLHTDSELLYAALAYAKHGVAVGAIQLWPWAVGSFKPRDPIRNLVKAGALLAAEIDRLLRREEALERFDPMI